MPESRPQDEIVQQLIETFHDYHTRISAQTELLHDLVRAVRADERERCAGIADRAGQPAIASAIRER